MFDIDQTEYKKRDEINQSQIRLKQMENLKNLSKYHLDEVQPEVSVLDCEGVQPRDFTQLIREDKSIREMIGFETKYDC